MFRKKIISIIMAVSLLTALLPTHAMMADSSSEAQKKALEITAAIGLINPTEEDLSGESRSIKRSEFATIAIRLMGMPKQVQCETSFPDVPAEHWASGYIAAANSLGLMNGDENGSFCPDGDVTYEQVMKVLVYMLGYSVHAEYAGGWPDGYLKKASDLKLTKNIVRPKGHPMTRAETALAVYNTFNAKMVKPVSFGSEMQYEPVEGESILSEYLDIVFGEDILYEWGAKSIVKNPVNTNAGYARIGESAVQYTQDQPGQWLGYEVEWYARENSNQELELLYAAPTGKNSDLTINSRRIQYLDPEFSLQKIIYEEAHTDKRKTAKVESELCYVLNGNYYYDFDIPDFRTDNGFVKLVDNNDDNKYDVVFVWNYENYAVDTVSDEMIKGKYNRSLSLKNSEDYTVEIIMPDGIVYGVEALKSLREWDIVSAARSMDGGLLTLMVSRDGIAGTVESSEQDKVVISGEERYVDTKLADYVKGTSFTAVEMGVLGEFYFDVCGNIAAVFEYEEKDKKYAYLTRLYSELGGSISDGGTIVLKLFTEDGEYIEYKAAERIKDINKGSRDYAQNILSGSKFIDDGGNTIKQLVQYTVDDNGLISQIGTASVTQGNEDEKIPYYNMDKFSLDYSTGEVRFEYYRHSGAFGATDHGFDPSFRVNENSKIFYIPTYNNEVLTEEMRIFNLDSFINNKSYKNLYFYDSDEYGLCEAIVYAEKRDNKDEVQIPPKHSNNFMVVSDVINTINEDDEPIVVAKGMHEGLEVKYEVINDSSGSLKSGMVLAVKRDFEGRLIVSDADILYSPSRAGRYYNVSSIISGGTLPEVWASYGMLYRKNGRYFTVDFGNGNPKPFFIDSDFKLYIYKDGKVTLGSENDLITTSDNAADGSQIVMNNRYDYVREIVIIEQE